MSQQLEHFITLKINSCRIGRTFPIALTLLIGFQVITLVTGTDQSTSVIVIGKTIEQES